MLKAARTRYFLGLAFTLIGCNRTPAEIELPPATTAAPSPAVAPLTWETPGAWTSLPVPKGSPKRATYKVPKAGNDKEDAEVNVLFFGTGADGDPDKKFSRTCSASSTATWPPPRSAISSESVG